MLFLTLKNLKAKNPQSPKATETLEPQTLKPLQPRFPKSQVPGLDRQQAREEAWGAFVFASRYKVGLGVSGC